LLIDKSANVKFSECHGRTWAILNLHSRIFLHS